MARLLPEMSRQPEPAVKTLGPGPFWLASEVPPLPGFPCLAVKQLRARSPGTLASEQDNQYLLNNWMERELTPSPTSVPAGNSFYLPDPRGPRL